MPDITDMKCDVCKGESGGKFVGVAAVPGAPLSVAWCINCLQENAIPRFVVESWLFSPFDELSHEQQEVVEMPKEPPLLAEVLADWAQEFKIWMGPERRYVKMPDLFNELWDDEYRRVHAEAENTEVSELRGEVQPQPDSSGVPEVRDS